MTPDDTVDDFPPAFPPLAGRWQLGSRLGSGGEGVVFAAAAVASAGDPPEPFGASDGRALVAKVTWSRTGASELKRYLALQHRHLATYRDFGTLPGAMWRDLGMRRPPDPNEVLLWIVMSRANRSLADQIGERDGVAVTPLNGPDAVRLWEHLASALAYMGEQRVVHGDIKPANVLAFDTAHGTDWRLADFGMSMELAAGVSRATVPGRTPIYASPGVLDTGRASFADDLYAAALTVHVAATGRLPIRSGGRIVLDAALPDELVAPIAAATGAQIPPVALKQSRHRRRRRMVLAAVAAVLLLLAAASRLGLSATGQQDEASVPTTALAPGSTTDRPGGSTSTTSESETTTTESTVTEAGSTIYYSRSVDGRDIAYMLDVATGAETEVDTGDADLRDLSFTGAGEYAAVTDTAGGDSLVVGALGGDRRVFDVAGNASAPTISPDGKYVAFVSDATGDQDVMVLDLDTQAVATAGGKAIDEHSPAWDSGADSYLHFLSTGDVNVGGVDSFDRIWGVSWPDSGSGATYRAPQGLDQIDGDVLRLTDLAFVGGPYTDDYPYLFVVDVDGKSDVAELGFYGDLELTSTPEQETAVSWCEEGIITSADGVGLTLYPANGKQPRRLTEADGQTSLSCVGAPGSSDSTTEGLPSDTTTPPTTSANGTTGGGGSATTTPPTTTPPTTSASRTTGGGGSATTAPPTTSASGTTGGGGSATTTTSP